MNPKSAPHSVGHSPGPSSPKDSLSLDRLILLADQDPVALKQITDLYLSKITEQLEELTRAVQNNVIPAIERTAHSILGASQMVGMVSWVPILRALENLTKEKPSDSPQVLLDRAVAEFQHIREFLSRPSS
jgi:HPt (histidine-containing phosphotransfer) domain-containing protein